MWQQMGGMMDGSMKQTPTPTNGPSFLWVIPVALIGVTLVGVSRVVYFFALPEMKTIRIEEDRIVPAKPSNGTSASPYESVLKTATAEDRRVLEVLSSHESKYLQK